MTPDERRDYYRTRRREQRASGMRRVSVTLTGAEYTALLADAKIHRVQPTAHLKQLALAQLDTRYLVPPEQQERLGELVAILRGVGNNLNQLARHANEMRAFMDTEDVRRKLRYLEDMIVGFVSEPPLAPQPGSTDERLTPEPASTPKARGSTQPSSARATSRRTVQTTRRKTA